MDQQPSKFCACKTCARFGRKLPLTEFTVNSKRKDGRSGYCIRCTRQKNAEARERAKNPATPPPRTYNRVVPRKKRSAEERVIEVLRRSGPLQFNALRRLAEIQDSATLSDVLAKIHGSDRPVMSKNGTGPRVYFINRNPKPNAPPKSDALSEPALSFSTISFCFPVIGGRS